MPERYQLVDRSFVFEWLTSISDSEQQMCLLDWLVEFSADPLDNAQRLPGIKAPAYLVEVPLRPPVMLRFLLDPVNNALKLINRKPLP